MLTSLYDFFLNVVFDFVNFQPYALRLKLASCTFTFGGQTFSLFEYVSFLLALISTIIILILCCLFVYKIIKLIGGLIR